MDAELTQKQIENEAVVDNTPATIAPDWTESEWFEVWLKLARREYQAS